MSSATASGIDQAFTTPGRSRFFLGLTVVMLTVVFLGFAPTFYLDSLFDTPTRIASVVYDDSTPMPLYLVLHGVLLTAWFAGLVVQSGLIVGGRRQAHKSLGVLLAVVAVGVVLSGAVATLGLIPRATGEQLLVISNSLNLLVFAGLVWWAIRRRRHPEFHKRLMLIASIAIIGPAVGPDRMLGGFLGSLVPDFLPVPAALIFWVVLLGAVVAHDVMSLGRVHAATAWGGAAKAVAAGLTVLLVRSGGASSYLSWLESLGLFGASALQ